MKAQKKKKKEKRKKLKEKHLRKESFASLLTLRHSSLRLMEERSMQFVQKNDPKADKASLKIWNLMIANREDKDNVTQLTHAQFNIALVDNQISVDPDLSVDLFYELIRTWEIIEKHREDKRNNPEKYANAKKTKYKQSRGGNHALSMAAIGGSSALQSYAAFNDATQQNTENEHIEKEKKQKEDEADLPQKDKIKYIKKKGVNRGYIKRMLRHINKNIKAEHRIANPKKLKKSKLLLVVFGKIFDAIQNGQAFDVQNDYISQALTQEQLNNPIALLEILETRDAEWKQRVQCLEYIAMNINSNENLLPLFEEENFLLLIVGWTTQLYDERSRITQTAAELFPTLLTILLCRMSTPAIIFESDNDCLSTILEGLLTLLKNKRAKTLSDIAHDVLIETINILATIAQDLDTAYYYILMQYLLDHSNEKIEKHEKVRAGCIAYSLFVIYGTESQQIQNKELTESNLNSAELLQPNFHALAKSISVDSNDAFIAVSDNEEDEAKEQKEITDEEKKLIEEEKKKQKEKNVKIAKVAQRAFLFEDEKFMEMFAQIIGFGIEDRGKECREKAMKCLKKIESAHKDILDKYMNPLHLKKYEKWKKFNAPKGKKKKRSKNKRISPIKRAKSHQPKQLLKTTNENEAISKSTLDIHIQNEDNTEINGTQ